MSESSQPDASNSGGGSRLPASTGHDASTSTELTVGREDQLTQPPIVAPTHQQARAPRRTLRGGLVLLMVAVAVTPLVAWWHYESNFITSRNALVKGELTRVGSRLEGVVRSVEVADGERVLQGQTLVRLESAHYEAEADQARARLEELQQGLAVEQATIAYEARRLESQLQEAKSEVAAAEAQLTAAESRADDASGFHAARLSLLKKGAISGEVVRDAEAKRRTAEALVNAAKAEEAASRSAERKVDLESEGLAIRHQRMRVLEAQVRYAEAQLAEAQSNLDDTIIKAPVNGAVVQRIVQPGGSLDVGQPIMLLRLGNDAWIEAWVDESDLGRILVGSKASVTLDSYPDQEFSGVVEKIGLTTDFEIPTAAVPQPRDTRMRAAPVVGVAIRLDAPPEDLRLGLSAIVSIHKSI